MDHIGLPYHTQGYTCGNDNCVTSLYQTCLLCLEYRFLEQSIRGLLLLDHDRIYTPQQI